MDVGSSRDIEVLLENLPDSLNGNPHRQRNFLETESRSLIDRYLEGEVGLHVHLRARNKISDLKSRDLALVFEKMLACQEVARFESHSLGETDSQSSIGNCCARKVQPSVPINSSPIIENFEDLPKVKFFILKSTGCSRIRLYGFNETPHIIRDDLLHTPHGLLEFSGVGTDNKFPLLLIGGRVLSELQNRGVIDARIQCGPELVEHLSKLEREWQEPITLDGPDKDFPCPVVPYISSRLIHLACIEAIPYAYEGLAMELRPRDAIPARLEW